MASACMASFPCTVLRAWNAWAFGITGLWWAGRESALLQERFLAYAGGDAGCKGRGLGIQGVHKVGKVIKKTKSKYTINYMWGK